MNHYTLKRCLGRRIRTAIKLQPTDCPLCGSSVRVVLFTDLNRREALDISSSYCRCSKCGLIYLNPRIDDSCFSEFDEIFAGADKNRGSPMLAKLSGGMNNTIHGWLHRLPSGQGEGRKILDIGSSSGEKLITFKKRGFDVHGVDLAAKAIDAANQRFGGGFICGSLESAAYDDNSFDFVRVDNTMEHINKPLETMKEIRRVLKPGGEVYVYVPNGESALVRLLKGRSINCWIPFHTVLYSPKTLERLLREAGFSDIKTITHTPPSIIAGTVAQVMGGRTRKSVDLGTAGQVLTLASVPLSLLISVMPCGEELVAKARRP